MGSNPIIGTSANAFYEGKFANTASSIDSARSRIKTVALQCMHYNFWRIHQTLEVIPVMEADVTNHIWGLEEIIALLEPSAV